MNPREVRVHNAIIEVEADDVGSAVASDGSPRDDT